MANFNHQQMADINKTIYSTVTKAQANTDDLIDELPVEKRQLSKFIIMCRI